MICSVSRFGRRHSISPLADPDGVYDPGYYNDRLLLGLKGTMSEAELYLIRQRMLSGKLAKAERGELAVPLPIGYARRPSGEVVLDPDEQAQHVVRLIFSAFRRLGTLNSVLRYLVSERIQLPVRVHSGSSKGELQWRRPTRETLQNLLHNPAYAGYYAYGRRQVEPRRKIPGRPDTGKVVKTAASGWCCCRVACRPTSARRSTRRTSPGWPPTGRPPPGRARRGTARRCCPGCCAAAAAAGTA
ncbi:MAG TPA: recombinase family protein [Streptosporangiaceae bacterium]